MNRPPPKSTLFPYTTLFRSHRQHFTDSGVVIQDHRPGILGTIVITHANVWPADEGRVAEDDPRLLGPGEKPSPENVKGNRSEEHTSELQSRQYLVCRLLLEK